MPYLLLAKIFAYLYDVAQLSILKRHGFFAIHIKTVITYMPRHSHEAYIYTSFYIYIRQLIKACAPV